MALAVDLPSTQDRLLELAAAAGPYRLKPLIEDVPLASEGDSEGVSITCLEYWGKAAQCNISTIADFE